EDLTRLFRYSVARHQVDTIQRLMDEAKYGPAKSYLTEYEKARRTLFGYVRNNNQRKVEQLTQKFGYGLTEPADQMTGLMIAAQFGQDNLLTYFLAGGADKGRQDLLGRTALQHLILGYDRNTVKKGGLAKWYPRLAPRMGFNRYRGRQYSINPKSMEFFMVTMINALRRDVFDASDPISRQCLLINDVLEVIEEMPGNILPEYRRRRQYVSGILSKNEVDRDDRYNKRLLIRRSRGCYDLHPEAEIVWEG
ncbi:MAG: ankyrin repeat domain-containing protein, partial [Bacteroidota bacterium]